MDDTSADGDSRQRTHRFRHRGDGAITTSVALAIAELDDVDPTTMEPLYTAVDPDLLDALDGNDPRPAAEVAFTYRGYRVEVDGDGDILVSQQTASGAT